jgi:D-glycero-alpha-D-manno-heptose-7-phosphate kinase
MSPVSPMDRAGVFAEAPCRADLAGGTLDLWPLYLFHEGAVTVNVAVRVMTSCRITPLEGAEIRFHSLDTGAEDTFADYDEFASARRYRHLMAARLVRFFRPAGGFLLETHSESPAGAGIAGSSTLMIATVAALARYTGERLSNDEMRMLAQNVEAQIINVPTGCQDYYPALFGGVNAVHLRPDSIRREKLPVAPEEIESRFLLAYTGAPRQSAINNWEVFKAHIDGDKKVVRNFESISQIAQAMRSALTDHDWEDVARLLRDEWKLRKSNYKGISTRMIDRLMKVAIKNGGRAAKVCGAGGGGCVVFMVHEEAKERVAEVLAANGARLLPFSVAPHGVQVTDSKPVAESVVR